MKDYIQCRESKYAHSKTNTIYNLRQKKHVLADEYYLKINLFVNLFIYNLTLKEKFNRKKSIDPRQG
jgi:hypothetical protein